jgi:omega-6 fatty acid desaturase (delta-12 desaturase)
VIESARRNESEEMQVAPLAEPAATLEPSAGHNELFAEKRW